MQRQWSMLGLLLLSSPVAAQELPPAPPVIRPTAAGSALTTRPVLMAEPAPTGSGSPDHRGFADFIGFISNPLQNIDPRAINEFYPLFASSWTKEAGPVPAADFQLYGAGLTLALSDRLAVGLNQGGFATLHLSRSDRQLLFVVNQLGRARVLDLVRTNPAGLLALLRQNGLDGRELVRLQRIVAADPTFRYFDIERGGDREGFLNLGGFAQYTLIQDAERQFLLTAGLRVEAPCGSTEIFEGRGPAHLAPYVTVGKGWGDVHLLATTGYYFPVGAGSDSLQMFYADVHLDRRVFGWLYPLVEFNFDHAVRSVPLDLPARKGFVNFGNFEVTGNIVMLAVGANAKLRAEKLEIGAAYLTSIATQHDFSMNGLVIKLTYRF